MKCNEVLPATSLPILCVFSNIQYFDNRVIWLSVDAYPQQFQLQLFPKKNSTATIFPSFIILSTHVQRIVLLFFGKTRWYRVVFINVQKLIFYLSYFLILLSSLVSKWISKWTFTILQLVNIGISFPCQFLPNWARTFWRKVVFLSVTVYEALKCKNKI